jgi:ADP-heptose:LPS heptosyltransferase
MSRRILVIRLGALGDFVLSFGPFAAIRARHAEAEITLLTTAPFAALARSAPWFDRVVVDARPAWWDLPGLLRLRRKLLRFDFVYDLQTSARSSRYHALAGRPPWSGIARGCSHPHANPRRDFMHTLERQREQLEMAGIREFPATDLSWLFSVTPAEAGVQDRGDTPWARLDSGFRRNNGGGPYALLVPGASPHRPAKRWPAARFGRLAEVLAARGLRPVVLGTEPEAPLAASIPAGIDLTGRTSLADIAALARGAALAVGNDTGPMHLIAAMGCPSIVLFSADSDPALTAPRGPDGAWPTVLRAPNLADLSVERVVAALP